ncbi:MAG: ParB/RepB/Spo0J family partition protein [Aliarcobacter sp.]|nr:ParB/RepB/Spo0J family partition protein [Aliarcobacter sp.]
MSKNNIDLDDLLGGEVTTATDQEQPTLGGILELALFLVYPDPNQPRKLFNEEKIEELANSIKEHGLLEPIIVEEDGTGKYKLVAGERRYRAHLKADLKTIKAIVTVEHKEVISEVQLIENIQREDLTPFEIALSIKAIWEQGKYTKKSDLAKNIGKKAPYVSKAFAVFNLCDEIIDHLKANHSDIGLDILQEISREPNPKRQLSYYNKYSAGEITREDIRTNVKRSLDNFENEKEKLDSIHYAEVIKEDILSGVAYAYLFEYPEKHAEVKNDKETLIFGHKNDFEKIKKWKETYNKNKEAKDKEEAEREKLNDEAFAEEVKKEIFDNSYVSSDSSAVYINGKVIPFKNENDIEKIKEWRESYNKAKEEKQKSLLSLEDCETIEIEDFIEEIIKYEEMIKEGIILANNEHLIKITDILEKRIKGKDEDSLSSKAKMEGLVSNGFIISTNRRFLLNNNYYDVIFFTEEKQKNIFMQLEAEQRFEDTADNANFDGVDTVSIENDVFSTSNFTIIDNNLLLQFSNLLLTKEEKEELFKDIHSLREKFQKSFEERNEKVL